MRFSKRSAGVTSRFFTRVNSNSHTCFPQCFSCTNTYRQLQPTN